MEQIKDVMKNVVNCLASKTSNMECLDSDEFSKACDGVKDLAMACYYCSISEAMEKPENEYGVNYDEHGRFYTPMRNSAGRFTSRRGYGNMHEAEAYRDMDYPMGKMYYSEDGGRHLANPMAQNRAYGESRYDMARRGYEEAKTQDPNMDNTKEMKKIFDTLMEDMKELKGNMTPNEKNNARTYLTNLANAMV